METREQKIERLKKKKKYYSFLIKLYWGTPLSCLLEKRIRNIVEKKFKVDEEIEKYEQELKELEQCK